MVASFQFSAPRVTENDRPGANLWVCLQGCPEGLRTSGQRNRIRLRMRFYVVFYVVITGVIACVAALAQNSGSNVVPKDAQMGAFRRAFTGPALPKVNSRAMIFRVKPTGSQVPQKLDLRATVCAIPLLEAHGAQTNDRITRPFGGPEIDPKMAVAPAVPACPTGSATYVRP
jgi:hypothetical protein